MSSARSHRVAWALALTLVVLSPALGGCASRPRRPSRSARAAPAADSAIARRADDALRRAHAVEPHVTPMLQRLAAAAGGAMAGLEHRFKSRPSLVRKIRLRRARDPEHRLDAVHIDDALRYTIRVDDQPPGRYDRAVHDILSALERAGQTVVKVKNYWPRGDNYSGVNAVLRDPSGLSWELQFHTSASLQARDEGHPLYEEMRARATPLARKRELFDALTRPWAEVPIPAGVLVPRSLHPAETIILNPPPGPERRP